MRLSTRSKLLLRLAVVVGLAFIYIPLIVIAIYAFNSSTLLEWPPPGLTTAWFPKAVEDSSVRDAFLTSMKVGLVATTIALVILPIALPGIVTGVALSDTFTQVLGVSLSLLTVIIGHATFCIVVVYNNVIARLRRSAPSIDEASADLGADPWQTFRYVTLPAMRTALVAGALLAFALSFDEIIVTLFTIGAGQETLPIWIFNNLFRPNQVPIVNAVAVIVVLLSILPVYLAHRLTREEEGVAGARAGGPSIAEATATP